jgi:hypothetical protein
VTRSSFDSFDNSGKKSIPFFRQIIEQFVLRKRAGLCSPINFREVDLDRERHLKNDHKLWKEFPRMKTAHNERKRMRERERQREREKERENKLP